MKKMVNQTKISEICGEVQSKAKKFHDIISLGNISNNYNPEVWPEEWKKINFKTYPRSKNIPLGSSKNMNINFKKTVLDRKSERDFNDYKITKNELSTILSLSSGIINKENINWDQTKRTYPSAGARYPIELYIVVLNSKDLKAGLYHYNVKQHSLELLMDGLLKEELVKMTGQEWVGNTSIVLILTSVLGRSQVKYGDRAYRYCLFEAGHIAQNAYLLTTVLNLKCCAIGGFIDKDVNSLLDLDDENEFAVYLLGVGR